MLEPLDRPAGKGETCRASSKSALPAIVMRTVRVLRRNSLTFNSFSKDLICWVICGLSDMQLFGGPRKAQRVSATAKKTGELKGIHPLPLSIN